MKPDLSVILVHYNHSLPPRYWTGEKWSENRDEASVRSSFSQREFYNAQTATGTSSGGVTVEFATYKPTKVITSYKP